MPEEAERGRGRLTSDQKLSPAGVGMVEVAASTDVNTCIGRLDAGEVELGAWRYVGGDTQNGLDKDPLHKCLALPPPASTGPSTLDKALRQQGQVAGNRKTEDPIPTHCLTGNPATTSTLLTLLSGARNGPSIFSSPVVVVWGGPADLASKGVGTTLGHCAPGRVDLNYQQGLVC